MSASILATAWLAVLLPLLLYIYLALRVRKEISTLGDFFPLARFVKADEFGRSTAAAGVSLATVILALVNLAPFLGLGLFVTIASYVAGFVLLYLVAPTILRANPKNQTLQAYLGGAYESGSVKKVSILFSFVGYVSIFSMELLVGVTVLEPFMGENALFLSGLYLLFIIVYSCIGGFKAVVATEQWQIRFVIAAVLAMVAVIPMILVGQTSKVDLSAVANTVVNSWSAPLSFTIGIIAMNLPAAISDSGTWQRICATRSEEDARAGIRRAIPIFIVVWGTLIVGACFAAQVAIAGGSFDPGKGSLMTYIVTTLATGGAFHTAVLFVFLLGLFAAMITTADSLLLVAAQMLSIDVLKLQSRDESEEKKINRARAILASIAVLSFSLFVLFKTIKFDVVQLIFSIYGANLALFPSVLAALFLGGRLNLPKSAIAATLSVVAGFSSAWISAIYGKLSGDMGWLYNAPVVALVASCAVFIIFSGRAWKTQNR